MPKDITNQAWMRRLLDQWHKRLAVGNSTCVFTSEYHSSKKYYFRSQADAPELLGKCAAYKPKGQALGFSLSTAKVCL